MTVAPAAPIRIAPKPGEDDPPERRSMLADLVEYEVYRGKAMSKGQLAAWIKASGSVSKFSRAVFQGSRGGSRAEADEETDGDEVGDEEAINRLDGTSPRTRERAEETADQIFEEIRERQECLDARYPFELKDGAVHLRKDSGREAECYIALLHLSVIHRYGIMDGPKLKEEFERLVGLGLQEMGFKVVNTGTASGSTGAFDVRLSAAATALGLRCEVRRILPYLRASARDSGADHIARFGCGDPRPGDWVLFTQATVSRSRDWELKAQEAGRDLLPTAFPLHLPLAILAVPYHVERGRLEELVTTNRRVFVLDRLRLARLCPDCAPLQMVLEPLVARLSVAWE